MSVIRTASGVAYQAGFWLRHCLHVTSAAWPENAEASAALGFDLWNMVAHGPADALNQTVNTQPAMLAAGVAVYRLWLARGGAVPALMAGRKPRIG